MKIQIDLFRSGSIREAKRALETYKNQMVTKTIETTKEVATSAPDRARHYVDESSTGLGRGELANSFKYEQTERSETGIGYTVFTQDPSAPYFEFGTGMPGRENPGDLAPSDWVWGSGPKVIRTANGFVWYVHPGQWQSDNPPVEGNGWIVAKGQRGHNVFPRLREDMSEHFLRRIREKLGGIHA